MMDDDERPSKTSQEQKGVSQRLAALGGNKPDAPVTFFLCQSLRCQPPRDGEAGGRSRGVTVDRDT